MVESEEAAFEFLIPDEQLAKAIEPVMRDLHNPAPGSLRRMPPFLFGFLSAPFNVGNVAVFFNAADDRANGKANFSDLYLADRAAMLSWLLQGNADDVARVPNSSNQLWFFEDKGSDQLVAAVPRDGSVPTARYITFGQSSADNLSGDAGSDHLYGNAGFDTLNGLGGFMGDDLLAMGDAANDAEFNEMERQVA